MEAVVLLLMVMMGAVLCRMDLCGCRRRVSGMASWTAPVGRTRRRGGGPTACHD